VKKSLIPLFVFAILLAISALLSCTRGPKTKVPDPAVAQAAAARVGLDEYLQADIPVADGFDFAIGDKDAKGSYQDKATGKSFNGWYIATHFTESYNLGLHTGEDWNGVGGGNTDLGQNVFAIAHGRVAFAANYGQPWGNVVVVDHLFYENNQKKQIRSLYAHLREIKVRAAQDVQRRQLIGTVGQDPGKTFAAHLHLELRWDQTLTPSFWPSSNGKDVAWIREHYAEPSLFIKQHRRLRVPQKEAMLVLIEQSTYRMRIYEQQKLLGEYQVSFGAGKGPKRVEGDNKTPTGMYFVIKKHRGAFDGPYAAYYGGYWIKINYPNRYDAERGEAEGLLNDEQKATISKRWENREPTLENTRLGGGIGLHGWIDEWDNAGPRHLSAGCVVMHLYDISKLYDKINEGAMVVIL
jgi:murein DD-endopeptidase MepM/ murein hydrolase activator NlpD